MNNTVLTSTVPTRVTELVKGISNTGLVSTPVLPSSGGVTLVQEINTVTVLSLAVPKSTTVLQSAATGPQGPQGIQGIQGPSGLNGVDGLDAPQPESSPQLSYTLGVLTRVDFASGNYKLLEYDQGKLSQVTYMKVEGPSIQKTFNYSPQGQLLGITETTI